MEQVKYQEKLASIRQKKLLEGDLTAGMGVSSVIIGIFLCFQTTMGFPEAEHPLVGWGILLIVLGIVAIAVGRHYITTCNEEYNQTLREMEGKSQKQVEPLKHASNVARNDGLSDEEAKVKQLSSSIAPVEESQKISAINRIYYKDKYDLITISNGQLLENLTPSSRVIYSINKGEKVSIDGEAGDYYHLIFSAKDLGILSGYALKEIFPSLKQ